MLGRQAFGVTAPIIREGQDLSKIVPSSIFRCMDLQNGDIIGITESVVARAQGNYITVDELANEIRIKMNEPEYVVLVSPIYSRNRFATILRAFARAVKSVVYCVMYPKDEVGNQLINQVTGVDIVAYYKEIVESEGKRFYDVLYWKSNDLENVVDCSLHYASVSTWNLDSFCTDKCEYGLLGANKVSDEKLKLFPNIVKSELLVKEIQSNIKKYAGVDVEVMIYGDGAYKDPTSGIWEWADPVAAVAYTSGLVGSPNEIKLKAFADDKYANLSGSELERAIKQEILNKDSDLSGKMESQGTTPRRKVDLLASLMDLMSGSGDAGTPIVVVRNYSFNYSKE